MPVDLYYPVNVTCYSIIDQKQYQDLVYKHCVVIVNPNIFEIYFNIDVTCMAAPTGGVSYLVGGKKEPR